MRVSCLTDHPAVLRLCMIEPWPNSNFLIALTIWMTEYPPNPSRKCKTFLRLCMLTVWSLRSGAKHQNAVQGCPSPAIAEFPRNKRDSGSGLWADTIACVVCQSPLQQDRRGIQQRSRGSGCFCEGGSRWRLEETSVVSQEWRVPRWDEAWRRAADTTTEPVYIWPQCHRVSYTAPASLPLPSPPLPAWPRWLQRWSLSGSLIAWTTRQWELRTSSVRILRRSPWSLSRVRLRGEWVCSLVGGTGGRTHSTPLLMRSPYSLKRPLHHQPQGSLGCQSQGDTQWTLPSACLPTSPPTSSVGSPLFPPQDPRRPAACQGRSTCWPCPAPPSRACGACAAEQAPPLLAWRAFPRSWGTPSPASSRARRQSPQHHLTAYPPLRHRQASSASRRRILSGRA